MRRAALLAPVGPSDHLVSGSRVDPGCAVAELGVPYPAGERPDPTSGGRPGAINAQADRCSRWGPQHPLRRRPAAVGRSTPYGLDRPHPRRTQRPARTTTRTGAPQEEVLSLITAPVGPAAVRAVALPGRCVRLVGAGASVVVHEVGGVGLADRGHPHAVLLPRDQAGDRVGQAGEIGHERLP